jgi:hypothetical protein
MYHNKNIPTFVSVVYTSQKIAADRRRTMPAAAGLGGSKKPKVGTGVTLAEKSYDNLVI